MYAVFGVFMMAIILIFGIYLMAQGRLIYTFDIIQNFGEFFIASAVLSGVIIAIQLYKKEIVDRFVLGFGLFFSLGSLLFLCNNPSVAYYYNAYIHVIPSVCFFVVGIITTIFTSSGFIGALSPDTKAVRFASLKLLVMVVYCMFWSLIIKDHSDSIFSYFFLPFIILRWAYDRWGRQLRGEKEGWSFKW